MASYIKQGESIFVPFKDGESIYDSQNRPRIYKTVEAFKKSFPVHNFGTDGIVLTEYVPNEQSSIDVIEVIRCKDCIKRNTHDCAMWYQCSVCGGQWSWETDNIFCSFGESKGDNIEIN